MFGKRRTPVIEERVPKGAMGFRLAYNPTRSKIEQVDVAVTAEGLAPAALPPIVYPPDLQFMVAVIGQFTSLVDVSLPVRIQVEYTGELLQEPRLKWLFPLPVAEPPPNEEYYRIYRTRQSLSEIIRNLGDGRQAFFFDLDRYTHPVFVRFVRELDDDKKEERIRLVEKVMGELMSSFDLRRKRRTVPPARVLKCDIETITEVFSAAAFHLASSDRAWTMGEALLQFAEGALGWDVFFLPGARCRVSHPDTDAIFLFAEFGLAAHRVCPAFWTLPLLLDLVKMQRYFLARFEEPHRIGEYGCPYVPLDPEDKLAIDLEYAAYAPFINSIEDLERLIHENVLRTLPPQGGATADDSEGESCGPG